MLLLFLVVSFFYNIQRVESNTILKYSYSEKYIINENKNNDTIEDFIKNTSNSYEIKTTKKVEKSTKKQKKVIKKKKIEKVSYDKIRLQSYAHDLVINKYN